MRDATLFWVAGDPLGEGEEISPEMTGAGLLGGGPIICAISLANWTFDGEEVDENEDEKTESFGGVLLITMVT